MSLPVSAISTLSDHTSLSPSVEDELDRLAWSAVLRAIWLGGHHLSEYVFSSEPQSQPSVYPLGSAFGLPWTASDGDLSSAVVVSLGASTKTARVFAYFFERRSKEVAPLGFLQVTSTAASISKASETANPSFPSKAVDYGQIDNQKTAEWLKKQNPSKFVVLDFGARSNALDRLLASIKKEDALQSSDIVIVQIGSQQKVNCLLRNCVSKVVNTNHSFR